MHVPHELTWAYEQAALPAGLARYHEVPHLGSLPDVIATIEAD